MTSRVPLAVLFAACVATVPLMADAQTPRALGLTLPPSLTARADRVIE